MSNIFTENYYKFPYSYKFPGQASDEKILFICRESKIIYLVKLFALILVCVLAYFAGMQLSQIIYALLGIELASLVQLLTLLLSLVFFLGGYWWLTSTYRKSLFILTTQRLTKFVYTTPMSRYSLSLPLDMIVDTGAYSKGFVQAILRLGTFTARSSASSSGAATDNPERINKKYFYLENISFAEDLQHYINKLLRALKDHKDKIDTFRPFIPELKGESRKEFMKQYPEYWS